MVRAHVRGRSRDETGASAVEYGLLVALIAAVCIVAVLSLGTVLRELFAQTCEAVVTNNPTVTGECSP